MKQFRPYHFPPLHQFTTALPPGASSPGNGAGSAEEWQAALADGYRQGQREGYEAGLDQGRADGYPLGQSEGLQRGIEEGRAAGLRTGPADSRRPARPAIPRPSRRRCRGWMRPAAAPS